MSSEITENMLKFNDEKEKELNKEKNELEKEGKKLKKEYDKKLKDLIDAGGFHMEGIAEIRAIIMLIQNCPEEVKPLQENMGKCLEILVNMSNQYLQLYKKDNIDLWNDENDIE
jgi:esterase/lipase